MGQQSSEFQQPISGTISSLGGTVDLISPNTGTIVLQLSGTWVGTVAIEGSANGSAWAALPIFNVATGIYSFSLSANGIYLCTPNAFNNIRLRASAYTSGTVTVTSYGSDEPSLIESISNIRGSTDGALIGNVGDRLKVDAQLSSGSVTITALIAACNIFKQNEVVNIIVKVETDLPGCSYTVPTGKSFNLISMYGSYDVQQPMILRLKKQTGGTGAFGLVWKTVLAVNGQDPCNGGVTVPNGLLIGSVGDVFKLTYEPSVSRGTIWGTFMGVEY